MNVCLVTAPTAAEFTGPGELDSKSVHWAAAQPQLGILSLAAVLEAGGITPQIVDLNRLYFQWAESEGLAGSADFAGFAAAAIVALNCELYGFGSICSSYPLTIRIAEAVKALQPDSTILFGGPQASVVDTLTLAAFPFVDLVLRGEAERNLPFLLEQLRGRHNLEQVPGLTYRCAKQPVKNPNAAVIDNLDELPMPAYHLTNDLQGAQRASLEMGRGCPYACTFCSTNDFFRRRFRLRSPARILEDMRLIAAEYGIRDFELVHDMFTVDRRRVMAFCEAMMASGENFTWSCSARTDSVDEELLDLMARSGCIGVFYGVEVGSQRMQKIIDKGLDPQVAHEIIDITERLGMSSTVSTIIGFPEETWEDLRETVRIYMHSTRCLRSSPQLNLLAPLAETPLHTRYRGELILDQLCSDMSRQGTNEEDNDLQLIRKYPDIFPNFYLLPTPHLDRKLLLELREFTLNTTQKFRWLLVAIDQIVGMLEFFAEWYRHRLNIRTGIGGFQLRRYYRAALFRKDLLDFVRSHAVGKSPSVGALLSYEDALQRLLSDTPAIGPQGSMVPYGNKLWWTDIPVRNSRTVFFELRCDINDVIDGLREHGDPVTSAGVHFYVARNLAAGNPQVEKISNWLGCVLRACDGRRTMQEIVERLAMEIPEVAEPMRNYAFVQLVQGAQEKCFIDVYRTTTRDTESKINSARDSAAPGGHTISSI